MPTLRTLAAAVALFSAATFGGVAHAASTTSTNPPKAASANKGKVQSGKKVTNGKKVTSGKKVAAVKPSGDGKDAHAKKPVQNKPAPHAAAKTEPKKDKAHATQKPRKDMKSVAKAKPADKKPRAKKS